MTFEEKMKKDQEKWDSLMKEFNELVAKQKRRWEAIEKAFGYDLDEDVQKHTA